MSNCESGKCGDHTKKKIRTAVLMSGLGVLGLIAVGTEHFAKAATPAECYLYTTTDNPIASTTDDQTNETWCYRDLDSQPGAKMIFNVDKKGQTRPELSFVVEPDGSILHASLVSGELTVHRVSGGYNPLPIPLTPPPGTPHASEPISPSAAQSSEESLETLTQTPSTPEHLILQAGTFVVSVPASHLPWRGYWWANSSGRLHYGSDSPMAKFDRYVQARTGSNPGSQVWEANNHFYNGTKWAGHCNGWAASSIMREEPRAPWTDPISHETFKASDLKGLWAERDYCPKMAFFGHRFHGDTNDDPRDIHAADFHNTLTYYLGSLKKPVLMDLDPGVPVENRVISGYTMKVENVGTNKFHVTMQATVHTYDMQITEDPGVAPSKVITFEYYVWTNDAGQVTQGSWISNNPDFLWIPLAPGDCDYQNPAVSEHWMETISKPLRLPGW